MLSYTQSTNDTLVDRSLSPPSSTTDKLPGYHTRHQDEILAIDLKKHHGDADKLYAIATDLQRVGKELRTEAAKLRATASLTKSQSKGSSRRDTSDSDYSLKKGLEDSRVGIAITYDPSDHNLAVRSGEAMKDLKYSRAPLPPFHWWTDTLHIYFGKNKDPKIPGPEVKIVEEKLPDSSPYTFIRTIKLGQLGFRIVWRRLVGTLDRIYVLSPESRPGRGIEMRTVAEPAPIL